MQIALFENSIPRINWIFLKKNAFFYPFFFNFTQTFPIFTPFFLLNYIFFYRFFRKQSRMDVIPYSTGHKIGYRGFVIFGKIGTGPSISDRVLYARGISGRREIQKGNTRRQPELSSADQGWRGTPRVTGGCQLIFPPLLRFKKKKRIINSDWWRQCSCHLIFSFCLDTRFYCALEIIRNYESNFFFKWTCGFKISFLIYFTRNISFVLYNREIIGESRAKSLWNT